MKAITCLLALSVFAGLATSEFAWKTGKSYKYAVRGRLMNGVSEINTQYAGLEVDYKVVLTVTGDRVVNWKATDFKLFEVNDVIKGGWRDGELRNERPVELTNEVREYLESPMDITFNRGVIESIKVDSRLPVWAINMKKAQASDFILDTTGVNTVMVGNLNRKTSHVRPEERNIESGYFYETMEKSIHGECNTYYTVSQNAAFKRPFPFQRNAQPGVVSHEVEDEELLEVESHEHKTHDNEHSQDIVRELSWHKTFNTFCEKKDQVYEIIKSVNFTACVNKPVLAFTGPSMHLDSRPGDNGVGTVASRSLITRFLACGKDRKQFTILKIRQEELVKVGLHITKKIVNGALKNLTLIELTDAKAPVPVNNPKMINNIVYNFVVRKNTHHDEEMLMDAAYMNEKESHEETMETIRDAVLPKPTLKEAPVLPMLITPLKVEEMKKRVETLVREIVMDIVKPNGKETMAEKETLDKINTVSKILRRFNYDVIEALYHKLADKRETLEDKTSRNIFLDCVAIAGTNPNVKFLLDLIEKKQVVGERACQILMTLPMYIRTPTKELLKAYFHLLKSDVLRTENEQLLTTAILSFSTVLYESCMNTRIRNSRFPVALFGKFCDAQIVEQEYLPWFLEHLEKNIKSDRVEDHHWRFVFLKALGNIGHPAFIPVVQRLMDNVSNPLLKTKVIWALQHMIVSRSAHNVERKFPIVDRDGHDIITNEVVEKKVLPILMSCAFDKGEHPEVRMAAITLLFYTTNADRTIWQQLAYMTWFEVSEEVHSLIYKTLKSLTDLKHPMHKVHRNMHLKALQVLHLCKPITPGMTKSRMVIMADHIPEFLTGFVHHWTYFGSKDSMIPNMMHYNNFYQIGENGLGFNPIEISFHGHTVQKLINHVIEQFVTPRMADREVHEDLTHIREILQIKDRQMKEKVEGVFFLKIRDELERMFTVNKDVIEKYAKKLMTETLPKLKNGIEINYQKTFRFYELTMEFPTIFGLPLNFKSVMPVHVSLRGNLKINAEENLKDMQLQADLHPVYAWKQHDKLSFKVPFLTKKYQTGIMNHMVAEIPFRALVRRAPRGQVIVAITPTHIAENREPTEELNLVTYHQKPYTVVITDDCWPTTHKEGGEIKVIRSIETPYHKEHIFAEKRLGLSMKFKEESDFRVERETKSSWYHFWQRFHTPSGFFNLGYLGTPTVRLSLRKLTLDMSRSETKTLALVLGGNWRHFWTRHHHEDAEEKRVLTIALIGKKMPIEAAKKTTGIQKILTKGTESTINYLLEITKPYGKLNLRLAAGEACKEAANKLPENIESLRAIKEYIVECPLQKIQRDLCVELRGEFVRPNWANRRELIVLRKRLLSEDLLVNLNAELKFGKLCTELPHEIKMEGKLRRGSKMTEWARTKSPQAKKCIEDEKKGFSVSPVCLWVSEQQAAALNKGNLVFTFTDLPVAFKNYTYMIEDWTKAMLYPYVSHDRFPQNGGAGEKKLIVDFEMVPDREFITVHINKPTARLSFRDVHVSKFYKRFLPLTATQSIWENVRDRTLRFYSEPSCTLEGRFINTFDNVTYSFKKDVATGCTHVLTKDCSGKYPMAVLVKDIHAERKTVTVLLGEKTKIKISNGGSRVARFEREENMKVEVNKEVITNFPKIIREHESDRLIAKIEVMVNGGIQVITPRIRVATDGVRVVVYGHNMYRNRTCGLCGDFDGERIAEMRSPKNCPLSTGSLLVASYAFPALHAEANNECKIKPEIKELIKKEDEDCLAHRTMLATEEKDSEEKSSEEKSSEEEFHEDECNIKKTLNKRFPGFGMCVSQNELHRCAPGCHAEKTHQKNVLFKCTEQGRFTKVTLKKFLIEMPVNCVRAM